mmetsp:Transcript_5773/g.17223  ORF Transcript_5773/g.17223 Transcript_5773/m.17223 type:complete len:303 (-) Transcript_5773:579-1487(-)
MKTRSGLNPFIVAVQIPKLLHTRHIICAVARSTTHVLHRTSVTDAANDLFGQTSVKASFVVYDMDIAKSEPKLDVEIWKPLRNGVSYPVGSGLNNFFVVRPFRALLHQCLLEIYWGLRRVCSAHRNAVDGHMTTTCPNIQSSLEKYYLLLFRFEEHSNQCLLIVSCFLIDLVCCFPARNLMFKWNYQTVSISDRYRRHGEIGLLCHRKHTLPAVLPTAQAEAASIHGLLLCICPGSGPFVVLLDVPLFFCPLSPFTDFILVCSEIVIFVFSERCTNGRMLGIVCEILCTALYGMCLKLIFQR